jgi:hypothetical protein
MASNQDVSCNLNQVYLKRVVKDHFRLRKKKYVSSFNNMADFTV